MEIVRNEMNGKHSEEVKECIKEVLYIRKEIIELQDEVIKQQRELINKHIKKSLPGNQKASFAIDCSYYFPNCSFNVTMWFLWP